MIKLVIRDDEGRSTVVPILRDEITIGRREGNTIRLTERNVSRDHARLTRVDSGVLIEDLDSYGGIRVNGSRIKAKTALREGDLIQIGDYQLAIEADTSEINPLGGGRDSSTARMKNPNAHETVRIESAELATASSGVDAQVETNWEPPRLVGLSAPIAGQTFPLKNAETVIGRVPDNDIVIDDKGLARHHVKIIALDGRWKVIDLGSPTGFTINGEEFETAELRQGDEVTLGPVKLRFEWPPVKEEEKKNAGNNGAKGALPSTTKLRGLGEKPKEAPKSTKIVVVGSIVVAIACVVVFALTLGGDKPAPSPTPATLSATAPAGDFNAEAQSRKAEKTAASPRGDSAPLRQIHASAPATLSPRDADDRQSKLSIAKRDMEAERWEDAVRVLYPWVLAHGDDKEIRALYDEARREDAASRTFQLLKSAFGRESWGEFVLLAKRIPDDSRYRREMMLFVGKLYERAEGAVAAGASDRAIMLIQQILRADPTNDPAKRLLADLGKRLDARAAEAATPIRRRATAPAPAPASATAPAPATGSATATAPATASAREGARANDAAQVPALEKAGLDALWNDPPTAIEKFNAVLKIAPNRAVTHRLLGVAYANLEKRELALHFYKRYLALAPDARDRPSVERAIEKLEAH
ncbi:MAG: FHA domain-containing protein [Deltaproteobacteria bacterium]|nr:FHA domain-containing protein [Deltaproteobacteria bacterium]